MCGALVAAAIDGSRGVHRQRRCSGPDRSPDSDDVPDSASAFDVSTNSCTVQDTVNASYSQMSINTSIALANDDKIMAMTA